MSLITHILNHSVTTHDMGGAVVKGISDEEGGAIVRTLREEYETHTSGDNPKPPDELQVIMTSKFNEITEDLAPDSLGNSLTYSTMSDDDNTTVDMLKNLTLKGTHFLDLMNYFEAEDDSEFNSYFNNQEVEDTPPTKVVDPWTQTMDMR
jgi:hypothetical protein